MSLTSLSTCQPGWIQSYSRSLKYCVLLFCNFILNILMMNINFVRLKQGSWHYCDNENMNSSKSSYCWVLISCICKKFFWLRKANIIIFFAWKIYHIIFHVNFLYFVRNKSIFASLLSKLHRQVMLLGVSGISIMIWVSFSGLFLKKLVEVFVW